MARLYEYQGKEVLSKIGIPVPKGRSAASPSEARKIAEEIGKPCVVKAQVWATGRFKAGGIKFAKSPAEAEAAAKALLGAEIKGLKVEKVLVEEQLKVEREFYVGVIVSNSHKIKGPVLIFSSEGGSSIEEVSARNPERIGRLNVDYLTGVGLKEAEALISQVSFGGKPATKELKGALSQAVVQVYKAFKDYDARSLEVNPLILTKGKVILAADCHVTIDDNSVFRHPELGIDHKGGGRRLAGVSRHRRRGRHARGQRLCGKGL
jgi:succinyl-CoA synthetase beta subunit